MANGIPALLGQVAKVTNTIGLVVADAANILGMFAGPQWGILNQDGSVALQPDSMISLDFKKDYKIPNYPQEQGAFQTYNKVRLPRSIKVRISKGGTNSDRANFIVQVNSIANSLNLYNVVVPEGKLVNNVNVLNYAFSRTSTNGVGLLSVDIEFIEIMTTATTAFSNTAAPSGADPVSTGSVQPQTPTPPQNPAVNNPTGNDEYYTTGTYFK
jgi:hypothetical protein